LLLLIYAIIVKYCFLSHPMVPVLQPQADGWLYPYLVTGLRDGAGFTPTGFAILAFLLLFVQALLLNSIVNRFRLLPGANYFPAFCFILFSSFFSEWNNFSGPLVANLLLLMMVSGLFRLYDSQRSRGGAFSLGFITGVASLFYLPALGLLPLLWITLLISRSFRPEEWILALAGTLCPYYFLATVLFLAGQLPLLDSLPVHLFSYPLLTQAYWLLAGMVLLIWWFLYGSIRLQRDYRKMMIHTRKCWQILLTFVCLGLALPFLPGLFSLTGWLAAFIPITVFIALGFWHIRKGWLALLVHLSALAYIFLFHWVY
jgi:hypothetical protein